MKYLEIDIETYAEVDLAKCGVYRYAEDPSFEILLFAYSVDGGCVDVVDLAQGEQIPIEIIDALLDNTVEKWAFNAMFERICLSSYLRQKRILTRPYAGDEDMIYLDPTSWRCTMIWAATLGFPLSLAGVASALKLEKQKMAEGKKLVRYFSMPCNPTKVNGGRTRNLPRHEPVMWESFKEYNRIDVEVEMSIKDKFRNYPVPGSIWKEYALDQQINDRGIMVDMELVDNAIEIAPRVVTIYWQHVYCRDIIKVGIVIQFVLYQLI